MLTCQASVTVTKHLGELSREQGFMLAHCFRISSPWSLAFLLSGLWKENMWQKKATCLTGLPRVQKEAQRRKNPLYGCLLVTSFLLTKPQLLRIPHQCHWLEIKPLWVNFGEGFLSNPRQAKGPTGWSSSPSLSNVTMRIPSGKAYKITLTLIDLFMYFVCLQGVELTCGGQRPTYGVYFSPSAVWLTPAAEGGSSDMAASPFPTEKSHRPQLRKTETTSLMITLWPWRPYSLQVLYTQ